MSPSWKTLPARNVNSMNTRRPATANSKDSTRNRSLLTQVNEGTGIEKAQIQPQEFVGIPGQLRFDIEHRPGDQFKPGMIQIFAQNWWTKREYRAVYGDADAIRIVRKPLKFVYQLMTKALSGESKSASVSCSVVGGTGGTDNMALLVSVIVRSEFDESTYDFKLPDVTTVADGSRLQDMILDLRQDHMRVTERASMLESLNTELNEKNSTLDSRVLQLERQVSILLGDHEQHMLSILNGFKATNEQVYGPVFARREGRRCVFNGLVTGCSPRGDHEGAVICILPDTLWPPYRLIFNGSFCTAEGHFCQYSIHVCRNGQVKALTYGKIMSMNLNAIDFWID